MPSTSTSWNSCSGSKNWHVTKNCKHSVVNALTQSQGLRVGVVSSPGEDLSSPNSPSPRCFPHLSLSSGLHRDAHERWLVVFVASCMCSQPPVSSLVEGFVSSPHGVPVLASPFLGTRFMTGTGHLKPLCVSFSVEKEGKLPGTLFPVFWEGSARVACRDVSAASALLSMCHGLHAAAPPSAPPWARLQMNCCHSTCLGMI